MTLFEQRAKEIIAILKDTSNKLEELNKKHAIAQAKANLKKK